MIIEKLSPTHPECIRNDYEAFPTIYEAVRTVAAQFPGEEERSPENIVDLSEAVQDIVRQSLRYDKSATLADLENSQVTTCVGYDMVGSESLQAAGIDHYVTFMNGHANMFVPLEVDDSRRIWMVDMLCSDLSQDVTDIFTLYDKNTHGTSYGTINAGNFKTDKFKGVELEKEYPWVCSKEYSDSRLEPGTNRRLIVTLNLPEAGREIIKKYAEFNEAYDSGNIDAAKVAVQGLAGVFPDVDIRSKSVGRVNSLVKKLAAEGKSEDAKEVYSAFYDSFIGDDTRVFERRADCIKTVAKISRNPEFASRALTLYEKSLTSKRRADRECVIGKIASSRLLLAELEVS